MYVTNLYHACRKTGVLIIIYSNVCNNYYNAFDCHLNPLLCEFNIGGLFVGDICTYNAAKKLDVKKIQNTVLTMIDEDRQKYINDYQLKKLKFDYRQDYCFRRLYIIPKSIQVMWTDTTIISNDVKKNCYYLMKLLNHYDIMYYIMTIYHKMIISDKDLYIKML
jgi:hypothetical protein